MKAEDLEDLFVPTDKCPLDFLAEMEERIKNAWIFADDTVIENLKNSKGVTRKPAGLTGYLLIWKKTKDYPETKLKYDIFYGTGWYVFVRIEADDISYKNIGSVREPNKIIRLSMAK